VLIYHYFSDRIHSLLYEPLSKQLLSAGDDSVLALWDMGVKRKEVCYTFCDTFVILFVTFGAG
jgi:hypothetical protein